MGAAYAVLAWKNFRQALILLFALLPTYLIRFSIGPIPSTMLEVFVLVLFVVWVIKERKNALVAFTGGPHGRWEHWLAPFALLLLAATLSVLWAPDKLAALGVWKAYFIEPALVLLMLRTTFKTVTDWDSGLIALAASLCFISLFAIVQKITGFGIPVPWDIEGRVTSIFPYPNALGLFVTPIVATLIVRGRIPLAVILGSIAIFLAKTEAAFVAIPAAIIIGLFIKTQGASRLAIGGVAVIAFLVALAVPVAREKMLLEDYSGQVRKAQWGETWEYLKDHPLTGAGLSGYPTEIAPYHDPTLYEIFQYPHNIFLNIWVELGLLGLVAFGWIAWLVSRHAWQNRHDPRVLVGYIALVAMVIHGLVDVPFFKNDLAIMTVFFLANTMFCPALLVDPRRTSIQT